jgi:bacteriorhodopsin
MIYENGLFSIFIQMVVNVVEGWGLSMTVAPKDEILRDILKVEFVVELIEIVFYIVLILFFNQLGTITPYRYIDWSLTTPLMLITLMAYMRGSTGRLTDFLSNNVGSIVTVCGLNFAMLFSGFLGEIGMVPILVTTALGFIPFASYFGYIYEKFVPAAGAEDTDYKRTLFFWFVGFWMLYGLFALFSYTVKNVSYNILDLFAKNFFGVFLSVIIWTRSIPSTTALSVLT